MKTGRNKQIVLSLIILIAVIVLAISLFLLYVFTDLLVCHHTWDYRNGVAATCVSKGISPEQYCTKCGHLFKNGIFAGDSIDYCSVEHCTAHDKHEFALKVNEEDTNTCTITGLGPDFVGKEIVIPAECMGKKVTHIGKSAFSSNKTVGVTSISFENAENLVCIENNAFYSAGFIEEMDLSNCTKLTLLDGAFQYCNNLTQVILPDNLSVIGENTFFECENLRTVIFGTESQLKEIGGRSFADCDQLIAIKIPDSVVSIAFEAFAGCSKLQEIVFGENSQLKEIGRAAFKRCTGITGITIPKKVEIINFEAFAYCTKLSSVVFADVNNWGIQSPISISVSSIDVSDVEKNAFNLLNSYCNSKWIKHIG